MTKDAGDAQTAAWTIKGDQLIDPAGRVVAYVADETDAGGLLAVLAEAPRLRAALIAFVEAYGAQDDGPREWLELLAVAHVRARVALGLR